MQFIKQSWVLAAMVASAVAQVTTTVQPEDSGPQPSNTADRVSFYSSVDTNVIVSTQLNTELQSTSLPASLDTRTSDVRQVVTLTSESVFTTNTASESAAASSSSEAAAAAITKPAQLGAGMAAGLLGLAAAAL